jgi:hypothetical protein
MHAMVEVFKRDQSADYCHAFTVGRRWTLVSKSECRLSVTGLLVRDMLCETWKNASWGNVGANIFPSGM